MSLIVESNYANGIPQTAVPGFTPFGVCWHWTAGGTGRAGWLSSVQHLINTRLTVNASYHGGFWHEHATERTYIQWIVPTTKAAHSVNPAQCWQYNSSKSKATQDARFAEVRRILDVKSDDPNAGMLALAYAGMPVDLVRDLACPIFVADVQNLARQLVAHPATVERPHFGHGWIQPISRYEMDVAINFMAMLYGESAPQPVLEDDMLFWKPVQQDWNTANGTVFYDGAGNRKIFIDKELVRSIAESTDGRWRLVRYGTGELLVVDARGAAKEGPGLTPVLNSRVPASGFGFPPPETITKTVEKIVEKVVEVPDPDAVANEQARIRAVLGI